VLDPAVRSVGAVVCALVLAWLGTLLRKRIKRASIKEPQELHNLWNAICQDEQSP